MGIDTNPYLRRAQHRIGKSGRDSERKLATKLGARARPASGAMQGAKGDMSLGSFLIEAKSTVSASLGVKHDWLAKISNEARAEGRTPALTVSFIKPDGTPQPDGEWVLVPLCKFQEMTG